MPAGLMDLNDSRVIYLAHSINVHIIISGRQSSNNTVLFPNMKTMGGRQVSIASNLFIL